MALAHSWWACCFPCLVFSDAMSFTAFFFSFWFAALMISMICADPGGTVVGGAEWSGLQEGEACFRLEPGVSWGTGTSCASRVHAMLQAHVNVSKIVKIGRDTAMGNSPRGS